MFHIFLASPSFSLYLQLNRNFQTAAEAGTAILDRFSIEAIIHMLAFAPVANGARFAQNGKVTAHGRLRQADGVSDSVDT
jgi:hypothetical protein